MSERGVSLTALIVTIIIIIILATIGGFYSSEILDKSERMDIESEMRNIEELVSIQKAKIMVGEQIIPTSYLADSSEIDEYLGADTSVDKSKIKNPNKRYYIMDQAAFVATFPGEVNVKNVKRKYLINFEDKVIILNANNKLYVVGTIE